MPPRRELQEAVGEPRHRFVAEVPEGVEVRKFRHLRSRGIGDRLPAVADVHAPQPRAGVEEFAAALIDDAHALGFGHQHHFVARLRVQRREAMDDVGAVEPLDLEAGRISIVRVHFQYSCSSPAREHRSPAENSILSACRSRWLWRGVAALVAGGEAAVD